MKIHYKNSELAQEIACLENTFDKVRVVDPLRMRECIFGSSTEEIKYKSYECYRVWKKEQCCRDCTSVKAFKYKSRYTKFEFINDEVYYVVSKYVEVESNPCVLEVVTKVDNKVEILGEGYNEFIDRINGFHRALYRDELTGVYNRTYMKDKLPLLLEQIHYQENDLGVAVVDIDALKAVNDTYGHQVGDELIMKVSAVLEKATSAHNCDFVTRYGGDEFIIVFNIIQYRYFQESLKDILDKVRGLCLEGAPAVNVSVSIGGALDSELTNGTMERLIKVADERLYEAKGQGKNRMIIN